MVKSLVIKSPTADMALRLILDELESQLQDMDRAYADAQWRGHFDQTSEGELNRLDAQQAARSTLLLDDQARATLNRWAGRPRDALLARRVTLLLRRFRWAEVESRPQVYRCATALIGPLLTLVRE